MGGPVVRVRARNVQPRARAQGHARRQGFSVQGTMDRLEKPQGLDQESGRKKKNEDQIIQLLQHYVEIYQATARLQTS